MTCGLEIPFVYAGANGAVTITCVPSEDPVSIGKAEGDFGFPVCTARVALDAKGYFAFVGWVQMVCSSDNSSQGREFEMDPLGPFSDSPSPFCFFGLAPTLFDAPSRDGRDELTWLAHSFLAVLDEVEERRGVRSLLGFEWGFEISPEGAIGLRVPVRLVDGSPVDGRRGCARAEEVRLAALLEVGVGGSAVVIPCEG